PSGAARRPDPPRIQFRKLPVTRRGFGMEWRFEVGGSCVRASAGRPGRYLALADPTLSCARAAQARTAPIAEELKMEEPLASSTIFSADGGTWYVLHTKSRQEKALSGELDRLGVLHFLPVV